MSTLCWSSHVNLEPHESPFLTVLFSSAWTNRVGNCLETPLETNFCMGWLFSRGMCSQSTHRSAQSTEQWADGSWGASVKTQQCFQSGCSDHKLQEMGLKEASHLLCMPSLWHQEALWLSETRVFGLHEPLGTDAAHFVCQWIGESIQKHQCQILQCPGIICTELLCLGKAGIYKGSGVVKKLGSLCKGEDVLGHKGGLICGYYCCLWSANRDLKLIHQSSTTLIYSARWRCQNRLLPLSLMLPYHEMIKQVDKASKG